MKPPRGAERKLLGNVPSATAMLDRFLHHAEIIAITGRSYRLRDRGEKEAAPREKAGAKAEKPDGPKDPT